MPRNRPAAEVARWQGPSSLWLDHAVVGEGDLEWMSPAKLLVLWNVDLPAAFLTRLPNLLGLSLRGGGGADLAPVRGCGHLLMLDVNQVRGLSDLSILGELAGLEFLSLYGLPRVESLPSLERQTSLSHCQLGSMKGLQDLRGLLAAPALRSLQLIRRVAIRTEDADALAQDETLEEFGWFDEDVPRRVTEPILSRLGHLPRPRLQSPEEWLEERLGI